MKKKRIIFFLVCLVGFLFVVPLPVQTQTRTIRRSEADTENLRLLKPTGITQIAPTINTIRIQPGEYLIARVGDSATIQRIAVDKNRHILPLRIFGVNSSGEDLNLDVVPNAPLEVRRGGPSGDLRINHTNLPFEAVTAHAIAPQDPVNIRIRTSFDPEPESIVLSVIRPRIGLKTSRPTIKGWGLETADINILVEGFPDPEGKVVILESTKGGLESTRLTLDNNGTAISKIRSIGIGEAKITASMANTESAKADITFTTPWVFFLMALFGGLVGSVIKILQDKTGSAKLIIGRLALGILIAIVVAVAFTVGVNLVGIAPKAKVGEAVIFVLAAIGAWAGTFVLPKKPS